jgi:integrase/recombinase XerD
VPYPTDGEPNRRSSIAERTPARFDASLSLLELFDDFLDLSGSIIADPTAAKYRYDVAQFFAFLAEHEIAPTLGSIDRPTISHYVGWLQRRPKAKGRGTLSSASVNHYARALRTFLRWLVAEGYLARDPLSGGRRGLMPRVGVRVLKLAKVADVEILLAGTEGPARGRLGEALHDRDRVVILLATDTGMRTSEIARIEIGHLDLNSAAILVPRAKWDRQRIVPLSREVTGALRAYLRRSRPTLAATPPDAVAPGDLVFLSGRGAALTASGLYQAMCRTYRRGGGTGRFGLHRLRHLFGTAAVEGGMHPRISQAIMGHADEKSQRVYQHPSDAAIVREHAKITPLRALPARRRRRLG